MEELKELIVGIPLSCKHPFNHSDEFRLPNPRSSELLLDLFLSIPGNSDLQHQILSCLHTNIQTSHGAVDSHNANLRSLVLCVEPFLKALVALRYPANSEEGNAISNLSLAKLMRSGLVAPAITWDTQKSGPRHDESYWRQQDCVTAIFYSVYTTRNTCSHETPRYTLAEVTDRFNTVVFFMLHVVAIEPSRSSIELRGSPFSEYLFKIAEKHGQVNTGYVDLMMDLTWASERNKDNSAMSEHHVKAETVVLPRSARFLPLLNEVPKMILVGGAGAGKSHSMRTAVCIIASRMVTLDTTVDFIPVYLPAYLFGLGRHPEDIIASAITTTDVFLVKEHLRQGLFWLFVDGLNEVATENYAQAIQELRALSICSPILRIVISTREASYRKELEFPVYRLRDLSLGDTQLLVQSNVASRQHSDTLLKAIAVNPRLVAFLRTPLQAKLMCRLVGKGDLPYTVPILLQATVRVAVEWEKYSSWPVREAIIDDLLGSLSRIALYRTGYVLSEAECLESLATLVQKWRLDAPPTSVLEWLINAGLLVNTQDGRIAFFHETALDYFAARNIVGESDQREHATTAFRDNPSLVSRYTLVEMISALLDDSSALINEILPVDVVLASVCFRASQDRSHASLEKILEETDRLVALESQDELFVALRVLMTVDNRSATNRAFELIAKVNWDRMSAFSDLLCTLLPTGTEEHIERCRNSSDLRRRMVFLDYCNRFRKAEYVESIISIAADRDKTLASRVAATLGSICNDKALAYLTGQLQLPLKNREMPIDRAIAHLGPGETESLLRDALGDADITVRRAAIEKVFAVNPYRFSEEAKYLIRNEDDLTIRVVAAHILLITDGDSDREWIIRDLFSRPCADQRVPVDRIIAFLSNLTRSELLVMVIEALCTRSSALQGLVTTKAITRFPSIAPDLLGLVDFENPDVTSSAKHAVVEGLLRSNNMSVEMMSKLMKSTVPKGIKETIVNTALKLSLDIAQHVADIAIEDPDPLVRLALASILRKSEVPFGHQLLCRLVNDSDTKVAKSAFRTLVRRGWAPDELLLGIVQSESKSEIRRRAIEALCDRHFIWNPKHISSLCFDKDRVMVSIARRILRVISKSEGVSYGRVTKWFQDKSYGFIREILYRKTFFVHVSDLQDRSARLEHGDLVSFMPQSSSRGLHATSVKILKA